MHMYPTITHGECHSNKLWHFYSTLQFTKHIHTCQYFLILLDDNGKVGIITLPYRFKKKKKKH